MRAGFSVKLSKMGSNENPFFDLKIIFGRRYKTKLPPLVTVGGQGGDENKSPNG